MQHKKSRQVIDPLSILSHLNDHTNLSEKRGGQFDPGCVNKLLENRDEAESIINKFQETCS